jgi:A/G-specific adenine glycosylase
MPQDRPQSFRNALLHWYDGHQRSLPWRETRDPYRIWVSEVMLQQTQVKTVTPYYHRYLDRFPDLPSLAASDLQSVLKLWEGLGYYARARNLHSAARQIVDRFDGEFPSTPERIRTLPGVGDYIASAVLSIAFGLPTAVVDGNVKRVLARLYMAEAPVNRPASHKIYKEMADRLIDPASPGRFNQAMMELGATICKPRNPDCPLCPVAFFCKALRHDTVTLFPRRLKKKPAPLNHLAAGVVFHGDRVLITRRRPEGLLGGLWEFPSGAVEPDEDPGSALIRILRRKTGLAVEIDHFLTSVRHAYTHFRIMMEVFCCTRLGGEVVLTEAVDYRWITLDEIPHYPFPKANLKFIPLLRPFQQGTGEPGRSTSRG